MATYTVKSGDTLWQIARQNGLSLSTLLSLNPQIKTSSLIKPGDIINLSTSTSTPLTSDQFRYLETEVIKLVNIERAKANRPLVKENKEVTNVARLKSKDFVDKKYFSHTSPTYGSPFEMLRSFNIPFSAAAENIASGQKTASEVVKSWMSSSGHQANILNTNYNQIGVGVARDNRGNLFWTQIFIKS